MLSRNLIIYDSWSLVDISGHLLQDKYVRFGESNSVTKWESESGSYLLPGRCRGRLEM